MRTYAFLAGLAGCAGDPYTLTAYVDLMLGEMMLLGWKPKESA